MVAATSLHYTNVSCSSLKLTLGTHGVSGGSGLGALVDKGIAHGLHRSAGALMMDSGEGERLTLLTILGFRADPWANCVRSD